MFSHSLLDQTMLMDVYQIIINNKEANVYTNKAAILNSKPDLSGKIPFHTHWGKWLLYAEYTGSETISWASILCI